MRERVILPSNGHGAPKWVQLTNNCQLPANTPLPVLPFVYFYLFSQPPTSTTKYACISSAIPMLPNFWSTISFTFYPRSLSARRLPSPPPLFFSISNGFFLHPSIQFSPDAKLTRLTSPSHILIITSFLSSNRPISNIKSN